MAFRSQLLALTLALLAGCTTVLPIRAVILEDDAFQFVRTCQEWEREIKGKLVTVMVCTVKRVPTHAPPRNPMTPTAVAQVVAAANGVWSRNGFELSFDPATDYVVEHSTALQSATGGSTYDLLANAMAQTVNPQGDRVVVLFRAGDGQGWSWGPGALNYISMPGLYNYFLDHELGHYLGLVHTFGNPYCSFASLPANDSDPGGMVPAADDDVLDTPADPSAWCLAEVNALLASGTTLLAGTNGGLFRSVDAGVTWTRATTPPAPLQVWSLLDGDAALFAGSSSGVLVSRDAGQTWTASSTGLGTQSVGALAASPAHLFAGTSGGLYRSADGGATWSSAVGVLTNKAVDAIAVVGGNVFAGTHGDGLFVSRDNGQTWAASGQLAQRTVRALAASGTDLLAATDGGLFRTSTGGASWTDLTPAALRAAPILDPTVLAVAASGTRIAAGTNQGLYLSTNGGTGWSLVDAPNLLTSGQQVASLASSGTNLLAGTGAAGIPRSPDDGATWLRPAFGPAIDFCADDPFTVNHVTFHSPPLRNVMSYNGCQPAELTSDQVRAVRYNLKNGRSGIPIYRLSP